MRALLSAALVVLGLLSGCGGGTGLLTRRSGALFTTTTAITRPSPARYLAQLRAEQDRLAQAEQRIPAHPRTAHELSTSAALLAAAVGRLAHGLAAIRPPAAVAADHARLVAIVRRYAGQLKDAARIAGAPGGGPHAAALLVRATNTASAAFSATVNTIYSTLGVRPT